MTELLGLVGKVVGGVADRFFPSAEDQHQRDELKQQLQLALLQEANSIQKTAAATVQAEIHSSSWLARSWRPITMLVFVALIVARWMGWAAPGLEQAEALELWAIVKVGLGGYVFMRSGEKVLPSVASRLRNGGG